MKRAGAWSGSPGGAMTRLRRPANTAAADLATVTGDGDAARPARGVGRWGPEGPRAPPPADGARQMAQDPGSPAPPRAGLLAGREPPRPARHPAATAPRRTRRL